MKLLFLADLHYALKQFDWLVGQADNYDVIVIGGDLLDLSSALDFDVQIIVVEKYLSRIRQKTRLIVSSGNHDGDSRNAANESVAGWIRKAKADGLFVDGEHLEFPGVLMTICPWWDGPESRAELEAQIERDSTLVNGRYWIWVHHAPPSDSPVCRAGRRSGGDTFLRQWIERFAPDLVLSGHIHNAPFSADGSWIDQIGKTWVMNPGRQIGPCPTYLKIDLEQKSAEWNSLEGISTRQLIAANG